MKFFDLGPTQYTYQEVPENLLERQKLFEETKKACAEAYSKVCERQMIENLKNGRDLEAHESH